MVISVTPAGRGLQPLSLPLPSLSFIHAPGMTTGKQPVLMPTPTMLKSTRSMPAWRCHALRTVVASSVEWDDGLRAQRWTCYRLDPQNSKKAGSRNGWWHGRDPFAEDELIPAAYRTTLTDYSQMTPHYDRGHICPSADRLNSKEANQQTYLLGNTGVWLYMENKIHGNSYDNIKGWNNTAFRDTLYICKGGTIDNNNYTRSNTGLVIPKYFFAAILRVKNGQYNALGLWFEHKNDHSTSLKAYACSIDELEKRTGIDFFCNLPDDRERVIEAAQPNDALWGLK